MPPKKKKPTKEDSSDEDNKKQLYFSDSNAGDSDDEPRKPPAKKGASVSKAKPVKKQAGLEKKKPVAPKNNAKNKQSETDGIKVKNVKSKSKNRSDTEDSQDEDNNSSEDSNGIKKPRANAKSEPKTEYEHNQSSQTSSLIQSSVSQESKAEERIRKWSDDKEEYIYYPEEMKTSKRGGSRIRKFEDDDYDNEDGNQFDNMLMKKAHEYHSSILNATNFNENQEPVWDQKLGAIVKREAVQESKPTLIGPNMCHFPLEGWRNRKFRDVAELKMELYKQEDEIKAKLNDPTIQVVFSRYFQQVRKKTENKEFISFKCEFPECQAILKISNDKDCISIYLFRNKHNHTIKGDIVTENQDLRAKPFYSIDLDPELHRMFGLEKDFHHTNGERSKKEMERRQREKEAKQADNSLAARRLKRMRRHNKNPGQKADYESDLEDQDDNDEEESMQTKSKVSRPATTQKVKTQADMDSTREKARPVISRSTVSDRASEKPDRVPVIDMKKQQDEEFEDIIYELQRIKMNVQFMDIINQNIDTNEQELAESSKMKLKKEKLPSLVFITNKKMSDSVKSYGHTLKIDIVEKCIALEKEKYKKQANWDLLIVSGINNSSTPVVLGFGLMVTVDEEFFEKKDSANKVQKVRQACFQKLFKSFLRLSNASIQINAIITPNKPIFKEGIMALKEKKYITEETKHFLDQYEIMKELKGKIKESMTLRYFKKLFEAKTKSEADDQKAYINHKGQTQALEFFKEYENSITYYSIPEKLVGTDINLNSSSKIVSIITERLKKSQRKSFRGNLNVMLEIFTLMDKSAKEYIRHEPQFDVEKYFNDKFLINLRKKLSPKTLNKFLIEYTEALRMEGNFNKNMSDGTYTFNSGKYKYLVGKDWICSCKYGQYVGLPCRHVIKTLKQEKKQYLSTIHKRWIIDQRVEAMRDYEEKENKESNGLKRSAPRTSRSVAGGNSRNRGKKPEEGQNKSKVKEEAE